MSFDGFGSYPYEAKWVSGRVPPADEHFGKWGNLRAIELSDSCLLNELVGGPDSSKEACRRAGALEKLIAEAERRGLALPSKLAKFTG